MYINVPNFALPGKSHLEFQQVVQQLNKPNFKFQKVREQTSKNDFSFSIGKGHSWGKGGEYNNTHCNGVGNINSPCQGTPTQPVPEPAAAMLLVACLAGVALMRKFKPQTV